MTFKFKHKKIHFGKDKGESARRKKNSCKRGELAIMCLTLYIIERGRERITKKPLKGTYSLTLFLKIEHKFQNRPSLRSSRNVVQSHPQPLVKMSTSLTDVPT